MYIEIQFPKNADMWYAMYLHPILTKGVSIQCQLGLGNDISATTELMVVLS